MISPAFARLWFAALFSETAEWMLQVALPVFIYQATGSAASTALTMIAGILPTVLLSPLAGMLADRCDRGRLLFAVCAGQAVVALPLLVTGGPVVYLVMMAQAALASVFEPARNALIPGLAGEDRLTAANGLMGVNSSVGRLAGSSLGGVVLGFAGLGWVVTVYLGLLVTAAALLVPRFAVARQAAAPVTLWRGWLDGLGDIGHSRQLRVTTASALLGATAQGMFLVLFVIFVTGPLGGGEPELGLLRGVQAIGGLAAGVALATLARRADPAKLLGWGSVLLALTSAVIWNGTYLTTALGVYIGLFMVVGAPAVLVGTGLTSIVQHTSAPGRISSTLYAGMAAFQALGMLVAGVVAATVGLAGLLDVQAALHLVAGLVVVLGLRLGRAEPLRDQRPARDSQGQRPSPGRGGARVRGRLAAGRR